jgi:hypothetical protein
VSSEFCGSNEGGKDVDEKWSERSNKSVSVQICKIIKF